MSKVIAIEGIDGSGKSVQFARLAQNLRAAGHSVDTREFPVYEGGFFGAQAGRYLAASEGISANTVDGKSMALWFALDRWEALRDYDGKADYLIINRYVLSNAIYQSIRDIDLDRPDIVDWVFELEYEHFCIPKADVFLFYDVAPTQAEANVGKKGFRGYVGAGKDVYEASHDIQARARAKYLEYARRRNDITVIPCMEEGSFASVERIAQKTLDALRERKLV